MSGTSLCIHNNRDVVTVYSCNIRTMHVQYCKPQWQQQQQLTDNNREGDDSWNGKCLYVHIYTYELTILLFLYQQCIEIIIAIGKGTVLNKSVLQ